MKIRYLFVMSMLSGTLILANSDVSAQPLHEVPQLVTLSPTEDSEFVISNFRALVFNNAVELRGSGFGSPGDRFGYEYSVDINRGKYKAVRLNGRRINELLSTNEGSIEWRLSEQESSESPLESSALAAAQEPGGGIQHYILGEHLCRNYRSTQLGIGKNRARCHLAWGRFKCDSD